MKKKGFLLSFLAMVFLAGCVISMTTATVGAFPSLPDDLNIVQPDPSLPKELADFSGKWQGKSRQSDFFLIVEKIDQEKATLRLSNGPGWETMPAKVVKEYGKYKIWFNGRRGLNELSLRKEHLDLDVPPSDHVTFTRVP